MIDDDDELAELEAKLKIKWLGPSAPRKEVYSEEDRKIARNFLGTDNAERLTKGNYGDGRKFRPAPPMAVTYEYYPYDASDYFQYECRWRINRVEGTRRTEHATFRTEAELMNEVRSLRAKGLSVYRDTTVPEPESLRVIRSRTEVPKKSARQATLDRLKGFKP